MTTSSMSSRPPSLRAGLPLLVLVGLAALASVRGLLHDLHVVESGHPLTLLLVFGPLVVWVAVAVIWSSRPFVSLLVTGLMYGTILGLTHIVLWDVNLAGADQPALGGNLDGVLPPIVEAVLLRGAAFVSSLVLGAALGAVTGLIAWSIRRLPALGRLPLAVRTSPVDDSRR